MLGMNINDPNNGVPLPVERAGNLSEHRGSHKEYNKAFRMLLNRIESASLSDAEKRDLLVEAIERARQGLLSGEPQIMPSLGGTADVWESFFRRVGRDIGFFEDG